MKQGHKKTVQLSLYDEFDIKVDDLDTRLPATNANRSFEIIYVLYGSGFMFTVDEKLSYGMDEILISTPDKSRRFEPTDDTRICTISFTEAYFSPNRSYIKSEIDSSDLFKKLEVIYFNANQQQSCTTFGKDKELVRSILLRLIEEKEKKEMFHHAVIHSLIFLLLTLIARKLQSENIKINVPDETAALALDVINYIQNNIYEKKKITLNHLSKNFGRSKESLLRYFRSATGRTVKEFITEYKLSLIKSRLLFSEMPVFAIADELDLTDESHLNKAFKSKMNMTPITFRELYKK